MSPTIWLAAYPKSGSTWLRMLIANLSSIDAPADINALASAAAGDNQPSAGVRFVKVHEAYSGRSDGKSSSADSATGAIIVVRDPRDIAPSLAAHVSSSIDDAIAFMGAPDGTFSTRKHRELRQKNSRWSNNIASWLEQKDVPVHLIRYEDLVLDPVTSFRRALRFAGYAASDAAIRRAVAFSSFAQLQKQEQTRGFRLAETPGYFFRRGVAGGWRSELTAVQVARIEADHRAMMLRLGYKLNGTEAAKA